MYKSHPDLKDIFNIHCNHLCCCFKFKNKKNDDFKRFFEVLALCHTVQLDKNASEIFQASSPDEFSFVKFCERLVLVFRWIKSYKKNTFISLNTNKKRIGIVFKGDARDPNDHTSIIRSLDYSGRLLKYRLLHTLEFDSTRKRMSVILQSLETNEYFLLCKGNLNLLHLSDFSIRPIKKPYYLLNIIELQQQQKQKYKIL